MAPRGKRKVEAIDLTGSDDGPFSSQPYSSQPYGTYPTSSQSQSSRPIHSQLSSSQPQSAPETQPRKAARLDEELDSHSQQERDRWLNAFDEDGAGDIIDLSQDGNGASDTVELYGSQVAVA